MLRRSQDKIKRFLPSGGSGKGMALIAILVIAGWLITGFYRVNTDQQGVALLFGQLWDTSPPGLHYNIPAPIGGKKRRTEQLGNGTLVSMRQTR